LKDELRKIATGISVYGISKSKLKYVPVPLPPPEEQQAIAAALSDVDAEIAILDELIAKKRAVKQGAMQDLLTGKERLPGFDSGAGYKPTEVGVIPADWKVCKFETIAIQVSSGTSQLITQSGEYPIYGSTGIIGYSGKFDYSGEAIIVARVGANAGKLNSVYGDYNVTDNAIVVKLNSLNNLRFFEYQLQLINLNNLIFGSGQPLITGTQLKNLLVYVPSGDEQIAISQVLNEMDLEITLLEGQRDKTRALKQGMMQELLTGKTRLI
jgi:type I restriction enzyme S subunit